MAYMSTLNHALQQIVCDRKCQFISYDAWVDALVEYCANHRKKGMLYFIGNGGSAGIAMHMTTDYLKNGMMRTHSMHDPAMLTCLGNDYGYEHVFDKQLEIVAKPGDILVAISSSGNSPNIVNAVRMAKDKSLTIVTLSGFKEDNAIRSMGDYNLYVPSKSYGIVESVHNIVLQHLVDILKERKGIK